MPECLLCTNAEKQSDQHKEHDEMTDSPEIFLLFSYHAQKPAPDDKHWICLVEGGDRHYEQNSVFIISQCNQHQEDNKSWLLFFVMLH